MKSRRNLIFGIFICVLSSSACTKASNSPAPTPRTISSENESDHIRQLMDARLGPCMLSTAIAAVKLSTCMPEFTPEQKVDAFIGIMNAEAERANFPCFIYGAIASLACKSNGRPPKEMLILLDESYEKLTAKGFYPNVGTVAAAAEIVQ